jgi:DNA repair protein RadC
MILLDDVESGATKPSSRLYQEPIAHWAAFTAAEMDDCFEAIQSALKAGQYVVCLVAYEYGQVIHRLPIHPASSSPSAPVTPLMQAWAFHPPKLLAKAEVDAWLEIQLAQLKDDARVSGVASCTESITQAQFEADVERIQEWIRCGDTYQINHTYRINGEIYGDPLALYARLRARQPGRFGAFIQEGDTTILSQSPELFVERNGDCLRAMPMKGTASAQTESPEQLASDPKNRAENIMIVDLLRNDLSRVALAGSVSVPNLFHVAQHGNVLQMTSTIEATAKPDLNLRTLLDAEPANACVQPGLGSVKFAQLKAALELGRRYVEETLKRDNPLKSPQMTRHFLISRLRAYPYEVFACLFLDNRHRIIAFEELFTGTIDGASVHPREVVRRSLHHNAAAVIFADIHPSGVSEPSQADRNITRRLADALGLIDIRVLDHFVIGDGESVSFAERGLL